MNRDSASSGRSNYRSRRYDDDDDDDDEGNVKNFDSERSKRGNESDKMDKERNNYSSKSESSSNTKNPILSRSKSPKCRWDDPVKLFSEVIPNICIILDSFNYQFHPFRSIKVKRHQSIVLHPTVSTSHQVDNGTASIVQTVLKWLTLKN